jgi:hypothetical protein
VPITLAGGVWDVDGRAEPGCVDGGWIKSFAKLNGCCVVSLKSCGWKLECGQF